MFKFVILLGVVACSQAGLISAPLAGPALGAPLLGKVTYNPPETTVVKQPIIQEQHEYRYRSVPTLVQPAIQPAIHAYAGAPLAYHSAIAPAPLLHAGFHTPASTAPLSAPILIH